MNNYLGIDIGATKIGFALINSKGLLSFKKIPTPQEKKMFLKTVSENIASIIKKEVKITGIGIGAPGVLNEKRTKVLRSPNLSLLDNLAIRELIERKTGLMTRIDNDANCFTLAEALWGAGKNDRRVFGITLGSGVGGGLVIKTGEKIIIYPCEVGHTTIKLDGEPCGCGNKGCLEAYCSKKFFQRKKISSFEAEEQVRRNNPEAIATLKEFGDYLGIGIANIFNTNNPEVIVIGGGLAAMWPYFLPITIETARKHIVSPITKKHPPIKISQLKEPAGAIGAALLFNS